MRLAYQLVLVVAACGGKNPEAPGTTTVTGSNGFTPTSTLMQQTPIGCSQSGLMANGNFDALVAIVADADLNDSCGSASIPVPHILMLQFATPGYFASDPDAANNPIVAGMRFSILDENVIDEDLCGNVENATQPTAIAVFEECPTVDACTTQLWATSGSVTVTSVSSSEVEGTFDLVLGDDSGPTVGGSVGGTFSAETCP
jgi:hypothetical protein